MRDIYHLDGLIESVLPFAEEKLEEIEGRKAREAARRNRRGAPKRRLKLVHSKAVSYTHLTLPTILRV